MLGHRQTVGHNGVTTIVRTKRESRGLRDGWRPVLTRMTDGLWTSSCAVRNIVFASTNDSEVPALDYVGFDTGEN